MSLFSRFIIALAVLVAEFLTLTAILGVLEVLPSRVVDKRDRNPLT